MVRDMKEADIAAWQEWRRNPTPNNMNVVLTRMGPLIHSEVNRWSGALGRPLLEVKAKQLAARAIENYNPNRRTALSTHVANQLKKLSRMTYSHQNVARIPEYQTLQTRSYMNAREKLMSRFGREPTAIELSNELGWSLPYMERFLRSNRREFVESGDPVPIFDQSAGEAGIVDFVYNDLSPMHQKIFEHTTGYRGAKILDNNSLRKKLRLTQGQLSYQKKRVIDQVGRAIHGES